MNTTSIGWPSSGCPGTSPMYASARSAATRHRAPARVRARAPPSPGFVPYVIIGSSADASKPTTRSNAAPSSVARARQRATARVPGVAPRRVRPSLEVRERRLVRSDHARARAGLDRHVADRHALLDRQRAHRRPAVLDHVPGSRRRRRGGAISARIRSLAVTPGPRRPVHLDRERAGPLLQQALRRQHLRDLAGADAERQRAQRAVRAGVAVAADDRAPRLREAQLGRDHVHDALPLVAQPVQGDARPRACWPRAARPAPPPRDRQERTVLAAAAWWGPRGPSSPACGRGRRTGRPRSRSTANACGDVTSCSRCRST